MVSAIAVGPFLRRWLWARTIFLTFDLTRIILRLFVPDVILNAHTLVIGTPQFKVQILPGCSGIEGIGLILAFGILWLIVFRKECRFPAALALLPLGVVVIFFFNAIRIAALVLIGDAGAREIAVNGFHSQAGWIAFVLVSVGFCSVAQTVPWFSKKQPARPRFSFVGKTENPTAAFLLPFLMILIAGTVATAATGSDGFEWLYPLRFFAAIATLWMFRRSYSKLNWKFDWLGPATGVVVFAIWIALDYFSNPQSGDPGLNALADSPATIRLGWIAVRVLAAVITVPLAEELAFRGFLMRRLIASDFESVSFQRWTWFALLTSSVLFGILHGQFWLAGIIAGVLFALVAIRKGRFGNAVVAHVTANALLAGYVLAFQKWHLW